MATVATPTPTCKALIDDLYGTTETPSAPRHAEPLPEAAFSLTLKGTIGGIEAMLTVRGQTAAAFQANVAAVRGLLDAPQVPAAAPRAPLPQTYGASQAEKALGPVPAETPEGWCAVHKVQMLKQANQRGSWWSHKTLDGWCKGK